MNEEHIDHDRLFKELLTNFFKEFMELFFPEAAHNIELNNIKFLQQEIYTDIIDGGKYEVDILVETKLKEEPGLILIHVEPQAYEQKNFSERMFIYYSRLYEKYRRNILPVAVFSYDRVGNEPDNFKMGFEFLDVLAFNFYKLELRKLNWREYIESNNPVAAALLSKMGFSPEEKVRVKLEFTRMLTRLHLDPARMELLGSFFESYLKLNDREEEQFQWELEKLDPKEVEVIMQITTSWHEKGRAAGIAEGKAEGKKERDMEIARKALQMGYSIEDVVGLTGLNKETILKLKKDLS